MSKVKPKQIPKDLWTLDNFFQGKCQTQAEKALKNVWTWVNPHPLTKIPNMTPLLWTKSKQKHILLWEGFPEV